MTGTHALALKDTKEFTFIEWPTAPSGEGDRATELGDQTALPAQDEEFHELADTETTPVDQEWEESRPEALQSLEHEANRERVLLLTRKYEREGFLVEEEARLRVLTERINRLVPPMTKDDLEFYKKTIDFLEQVESESQRLERKLGIDQSGASLSISED